MKYKISVFIICVLVLSCKTNENPLSHPKFDELNKYSMNKVYSKSGEYLYVCSSEEALENNNSTMQINITVDGFDFNIGEKSWWFILSVKNENIIYKGENISIFDTDKNVWYKDSDNLILGNGIGYYSNLRVYKCIDEKVIPYYIQCSIGEENELLITNDSSFLIYAYPIIIHEEYDRAISGGIKVLNLSSKEEIRIEPKNERGILHIKDVSNRILEYEEYTFTDEFYALDSIIILSESKYNIDLNK